MVSSGLEAKNSVANVIPKPSRSVDSVILPSTVTDPSAKTLGTAWKLKLGGGGTVKAD